MVNRIAAIQAGSSPSQWRHVGTAHNPADVVSRGISPSRLASCTNWLRDSDFLWKDEDAWPVAPIGLISTSPVDQELLKCIKLIAPIPSIWQAIKSPYTLCWRTTFRGVA